MSTQVTNPMDTIFVKDPSIVARQIAGEMILVPIRQNVGDLESIYLLNETALFAWERFDGKTSLIEICKAITQEFDVTEEQAGADLLELAEHLEKVGAILRP